MRTKFLTSLSAFAGLFPCVLSASIVLGTYTFNDVISASNTADHIMLSNFGVGTGVTATFPNYSGLGHSGKSNLFFNAGFNSTNQAGAVDTNRYIGFSSQVEAGYFVDFTSISFYTLRRTEGDSTSGVGAPDNYALFVSLDNYSAPVATGTIDGNDSNAFSLNALDLSETAILQTVTDSVEFRLFLWRAGGVEGTHPNDRQLRIDDFSVSGSVTVIPEPAAYGFIGIAALVLVFWRRFRHRG